MKNNTKKPWVLAVTNFLLTDQRMHRIANSLHSDANPIILVGRKPKYKVQLPQNAYQQVEISVWPKRGKLFYFFYNCRLLFYLLSQKISGITANDTDTLLACTLASKVKNVPLFFDAHELFPDLPELEGRWFSKKMWQWLEKLCLQHTIKRYTVSNGVANVYEKRYGFSFEVVRNMPNKKAQNLHQNNKKYLLYQGALNIGRGLEVLIKMAESLPLPLFIAGDGDIFNHLKEEVDKNGLQEKVFLTGKLSPEKLLRLTEGAEIGFNLLENKGLSYLYSLANKFFDYVQSGVPQVCIAFPEYETLNKEFEVAVLVKDLSENEILKAVNSILSTEKNKQLKENCKKAAQVWNWENEELLLKKIYNNA